jgi:hypothetical protein
MVETSKVDPGRLRQAGDERKARVAPGDDWATTRREGGTGAIDGEERSEKPAWRRNGSERWVPWGTGDGSRRR